MFPWRELGSVVLTASSTLEQLQEAPEMLHVLFSSLRTMLSKLFSIKFFSLFSEDFLSYYIHFKK